MPDIILRDAAGNEVIYRGVTSVEFLEAPPEEKNTTGGTQNGIT